MLKALRVGWEMEEAPAKLEKNHKTRMEILQEHDFYNKNVSPLVTGSGLLLPKISFKEILSQRLISQKPLEIFSSKVVENIATSCLKGLQIVGRHSSLIY